MPDVSDLELFKTPDEPQLPRPVDRRVGGRAVARGGRDRCAALLWLSPSSAAAAPEPSRLRRPPIVRSAAPPNRSRCRRLTRRTRWFVSWSRRFRRILRSGMACHRRSDSPLHDRRDRRCGREDRDASTPDAPAVVQLSRDRTWQRSRDRSAKLLRGTTRWRRLPRRWMPTEARVFTRHSSRGSKRRPRSWGTRRSTDARARNRAAPEHAGGGRSDPG